MSITDIITNTISIILCIGFFYAFYKLIININENRKINKERRNQLEQLNELKFKLQAVANDFPFKVLEGAREAAISIICEHLTETELSMAKSHGWTKEEYAENKISARSLKRNFNKGKESNL